MTGCLHHCRWTTWRGAGSWRGCGRRFKEGGLKAGVRFIGETVGEAAPQVIRHLYDQGLFRGIRSAGEWDDILNGARQGTGLDVHHLIEQRFARDVLGLDPNDMPAVVLDRTFHQQEVTAQLLCGTNCDFSAATGRGLR